MNSGFDPKFAPVKSKDVAPEAEVTAVENAEEPDYSA